MLLNPARVGLIMAALRFNAMVFAQQAKDAKATLQFGNVQKYMEHAKACSDLADEFEREGNPKGAIRPT